MTVELVLGALVGGGLFLLIFALIPRRKSLVQELAAFDAARAAAQSAGPVRRGAQREGAVTRSIGGFVARFCAEQGWEFPSVRANLSIVGRSFENYLATKVLLALFGFILIPILFTLAGVAGIQVSVIIPVWVALIFGIVFFFLPDLEVKQKADQRRKDFRHAVGAFLDLVSMNLSGGRGVPEALMSASEIGSTWSLSRIRDALANARITGQTPWQALGALGEEVKVDELRDLSAALGLVADDGAKVRESLNARAVSLRRRELADLEGQAGERSQSMLVAQMLMAAGFMVFLIYPAIQTLIGALYEDLGKSSRRSGKESEEVMI
ncbi:MAG: type II secretion system F family protein [Streptosporangiaceae bacterium]|nr:type II secretion system F family protein [Streptosporangiaceae bacterium]MBV9855994.1 type II secretion system F family protein [Streptosporangiaceae bacterium]